MFSSFFLSPDKLLWTLGFLIPLILLYLIRPKPANVAVPSLMFILKDMGKSNVHRFFRTILKDILFLIQFLTILLLALALAQPFINVHQESLVNDAIIIMDVSASTRAHDDDRFEEIQDLAIDSLSKDNIIILSNVNPQILDRNGNSKLSAGDAKDAIKELEPTDMMGDLPTTLDIAAQYVGPNTRVSIISDFVLSNFENPDLIEARIKVLRSKGAIVDLQMVGTNGSNVGIVDAQLNSENATISLKIQNFNPTPEEFSMTYNGDDVAIGKNILEPAGRPGSLLSLNIPLGNGKSEIKLEPKDDFMPDNVYYVSVPDKDRINVLVISNDQQVENSRVIAALEAAGDQFTRVEIEYGKPPKVPDLEHDIYVMKDVDPQFVLPGVIKGIHEAVEAGAVLVVLAQPDLFSIDFEDLLPVEHKSRADPLGGRQDLIPNTTLSLMRGLGDIGQADGSQVLRVDIAETGVAFASIATNDGLEPVIAAKRIGAGATIYYGIRDQRAYDVDPQSYAIIWGRLVDFSLTDPMHLNVGTGSVLTSTSRIKTPMGRLESPVLASQAGFYTTSLDTLAVNLYSLHPAFGSTQDTNIRLESDINNRIVIGGTDDATGAEDEKDLKIPKDLTVILVLSGLIIMLFELLYVKWRGDL